jgi:hypothetical protein
MSVRPKGPAPPPAFSTNRLAAVLAAGQSALRLAPCTGVAPLRNDDSPRQIVMHNVRGRDDVLGEFLGLMDDVWNDRNYHPHSSRRQ